MANPAYPDGPWSTQAPSPAWMPWQVKDSEGNPIATCGNEEMALSLKVVPDLDQACYELVNWWDGLTGTQRTNMIAVDSGIETRVEYARTVKIRGGSEG